MKLKKKFILAILVVALAAGMILPATVLASRKMKNAGPDFTLINNSGRTIVNVYLSPSAYADWAPEDELIDRPLHNGEAVEIDFLSRWDKIQPYDLRVEYRDGTYDEWTELDLYHIYEMGIERNGASSYRTID